MGFARRGAGKVGVVIPAFNEARLLGTTLRGLPGWIDLAIVVDDGSRDATAEVALGVAGIPVRLCRHDENRGVGAAIVTGYRACLDEGVDIAVVMGADNQMHPDDLRPLLAPILRGRADYVVGDRLAWPGGWRAFPASRLLGVLGLGVATRMATGLPVRDAQCGYTAITREALERLPLESLYPRYGFPNDLLAKASMAGLAVTTTPVRPIYADETSDLCIAKVVAPLLRITASNAFARMRRGCGVGGGAPR
jgi:glycosyltransferase involved in cell wall biosynthesis